MNVALSPPVTVALSPAGEQRWGYTQFPALSRLPDGRILLMYADAPDASESHGEPGVAFVSADDGATWQAHTDEPVATRPHFAVTSLPGNEALIVPSQRYFDCAGADWTFPEPVATAQVYGTLYTYRCRDLPDHVQDYFRRLPALRYDPRTGAWQETAVDYDMHDRLAWRREGTTLLPRPFFERPATVHGGEVMFADYRVRFAMDDGTVPPKGCTWLMVSGDGGRSFRRRALVGGDPTGGDLMGEAALAATASGELVCVMRRTDQVQKPMAITRSTDDGYTWAPVADLFEFGVFPNLLALDNGVLVLSYGRPGVHLAFGADGTGRRWDHHEAVIPGDHGAVQQHSCGYTSLLRLSADSCLLAYSDFEHAGDQGGTHKAILVRRITATPRPSTGTT
jgi:hypothetical protein